MDLNQLVAMPLLFQLGGHPSSEHANSVIEIVAESGKERAFSSVPLIFRTISKFVFGFEPPISIM